ncbi:poly(ethylene terephthalate) hydrolase family protein [Sorangium sp. So ce854]|uniref:poly(ethylene terephthalate) hydrolase family protein n=1 Tax=Sorangium sp. So ce854 TaxID=3133322 RepID=UPI003F631806
MPTTISGFFLQCASRGALELVLPAADAPFGVEHHRREGAGGPWRHVATFARELGEVGAATLIQSNFGDLGNLEAVARAGDRLAAFWCAPAGEPSWSEPRFFAEGAAGDPALIQGGSGGRGDFELVVPHASGGIAHYHRDNDTAELAWRGPTVLGADVGRFEAVAMIQRGGDLEVVARAGDRLLMFRRVGGHGGAWQGPEEVVSGVRGTPALFRSTSGGEGALELYSPLAGVGLARWCRSEGARGARFRGPTVFATDLGRCDAVSAIERRPLGRIELAVRAGGQVFHIVRNGDTWSRPVELRSGSAPPAAAPSAAEPPPPAAEPPPPAAEPPPPAAEPPPPAAEPPPPATEPPPPAAEPPPPAAEPPPRSATRATARLRAGPHRAGFRRIGALSLSADACYPDAWPFQGALYRAPARAAALLYYPASADGEEAPLSPGGPFPAIAIAHERRLAAGAAAAGAPGGLGQDYRQLAGVMAHLARWGFVVIAPDLSWLTPDDAPRRRAAVLRDALSHLRAGSRGPLLADFDRLGLLGHGLGAQAALALALDAACPFDIRALALLAPSGEPERASPIDALAPRPVLLVRGTADPIAADAPAALYHRARAPKHLVTVPGASHFGYTTSLGAEPHDGPAELPRREQQAIAMGYLAAFFNGYLRDARGCIDALAGKASLEGLETSDIPVSAEMPGGGAGA